MRSNSATWRKKKKTSHSKKSTPSNTAGRPREAEEMAEMADRVHRPEVEKKCSFALHIRSLALERSRANRGAHSRVSPWRSVARETPPPAVRSGRRFNTTSSLIPIFTNTTHFAHKIPSLSPTLRELGQGKGTRENFHYMGSFWSGLSGRYRRRNFSFSGIPGRSAKASTDALGGGQWHRNTCVGTKKHPHQTGGERILAGIHPSRCHETDSRS